jgi:hypothetical protein
LKIEEEASKYEFLRRPQLIFKKEFVDTPKKYNNNRRFEEAIEVRPFLCIYSVPNQITCVTLLRGVGFECHQMSQSSKEVCRSVTYYLNDLSKLHV